VDRHRRRRWRLHRRHAATTRYVGTDPKVDIARGFFTPHLYATDGAGVVDLDSGARLKSNLTAKLKDGTSSRMTGHGYELIRGDEAATRVTPGDRFPGHLG
jgi:hypothetical protein